MPRYYFHCSHRTELKDNVGVELADPKEAQVLAVLSSSEAIRDLREKFWEHPEWKAWVTDDSGATVCALQFAAGPGPT